MIKNIIFSIAKKEIMDNIRNKWIIIITILFASLALLSSYAGSIDSEGWQDLDLTVSAMISLVNFLITIIALILGYSSIVGEIEKGSMSSFISLPTKRIEILIGKFIGLGTVLTFTILVGFGIAGVVIGANVPDVNYLEYLFFIGATILIGLVFLSIGILLSCLFKKRSTAMGGAIFVFFLFTIIWQFIVVAIVLLTGGLSLDSIPDWYFALNFFNPLNAYGTLISLNIGSVGLQPGLIFIEYPGFFNSTNMFIALLVWLVLPLVLAYWKFKEKDI